MPSFELFDEQPQTYRDEVLPPAVTARVAVEAGIRQGWDKYLGSGGAFVGLDTFGASAPYENLQAPRHDGGGRRCQSEGATGPLAASSQLCLSISGAAWDNAAVSGGALSSLSAIPRTPARHGTTSTSRLARC